VAFQAAENLMLEQQMITMEVSNDNEEELVSF
jgi:hypothetical protein